jgi:hypothetical protein
MTDIKAGAVLIKENTLLPKGLEFTSEVCVPGWKIVTKFDGYGLDREIRKLEWTFFCVAGEVKATVFGIDAPSMMRRAVTRILKNPKLGAFNSLEITQVVSVGSRRFPGIWYMTVHAHLRHIQQSLFLSEPDRPRSNAVNGIPVGDKTVRAGETTEQLAAARF